jgi:NADH-quinone oxidoreductase subunit M
MSGFISEALVFLGAFQTNQLWTILSTLGIVLGAGYMLWTFQRVFMGTLPEKWDDVLTDVNGREIFTLAPLAIIIIVLGVYPTPALDWMAVSLGHLVDVVKSSAAPVLSTAF